MVKYGASGTPMEINNKQAVFDVAPTWDGGGQAVCTKIMCVGGCVCVSVLVLQSAPCWVNNRSTTPSLVTGVGAEDFI